MTSHRTSTNARAHAWAFFLTLLATLALTACAARPPRDDAARATALDLDNRAVDPLDNAAPATVLIFVRTDCPVSNRFAPEVRRLADAYQPRGARFYLVYVDPTQSPEEIRQHLADYHYTCQALRDPDHALVRECRATITPQAVVFDRARTITYSGRINDLYADLGKARAQATTHDLEDAIEATLAGKPVAQARTQAVGCTIADLQR
jgi:hypothetical protein